MFTMSSFNFDYMLVGQVLLDEAACCSPGVGPFQHKSTPSYPLHQQDHTKLSGFLSPYSAGLCDNFSLYNREYTSAGRHGSPSACTLMERTLYPIYEEDEDGEDYYDDDDDVGAFNAPILRFFKSCLVQFAYMMPTEKALKSPPPSPR